MAVIATRKGTTVMTGKVRLSYAHLFEKHAQEGQEPQYSVSLIIPKSDTETIKLIKEAIAEAKELGKAKLGGKIPANLKTTLHDGDDDKPDDENYKNCFYMNANSKINKPGVIDRRRVAITDPQEVYSGCYGRVEINFYAYNVSGSKGIASGLGNVQKISEGKPLGGFTRAEDVFDEIEDDEDEDGDFLD